MSDPKLKRERSYFTNHVKRAGKSQTLSKQAIALRSNNECLFDGCKDSERQNGVPKVKRWQCAMAFSGGRLRQMSINKSLTSLRDRYPVSSQSYTYYIQIQTSISDTSAETYAGHN